ncbi:MAG: hypothetical protein KDK36_07325, partial [Leptospiraceae bacterium]|nr:hypothetical protein [Leptospiraceae bacterium]
YVKGGTKFDIRLIILKNSKPDNPKKVPMEYGNGIDKANSWEDLYKLLIESPQKSASSHQAKGTNNKDKDLEILKRITPEIQHDTLFDTMVYRKELNNLLKIIDKIPKSSEEIENVRTKDLTCYLHIFGSPAIDLYVTNFVNYDNDNLDEIELRLIGSIPSDGTFEFGYYTLEQLEYLYKEGFKRILVELDFHFTPTRLSEIKDARNDYYNEEEDEYEKEPIDKSDDDFIGTDHRGLEDEQGEIGTINGRVAHDLPSSWGQFDTQRRVHESDSDEDSGMESDGRRSTDFISEGTGKGHGRISQQPELGEREFQSSERDSTNNEGSIDEDKLKSVEKILEILESKGFEF